MPSCKIVFSDIDGTVLTTDHRVTPLTNKAIHRLQEQNIPFVLVSARSPSGIYPIMQENNFNGPIISYSGALILNQNHEFVYNTGIPKHEAIQIIHYAEEKKLDVHWCAYCGDEWVVKDKSSPRVQLEERTVKAQSIEKPLEAFAENASFNKIMFICSLHKIAEIEQEMKLAFPEYSIVQSSKLMLEIMKKGINKGEAVKNLCNIWNIDPKDALAFGDNYNDLPMLKSVGHGYLMGNAPEPLKKQIPNITLDNNHDGIYDALTKLNLI